MSIALYIITTCHFTIYRKVLQGNTQTALRGNADTREKLEKPKTMNNVAMLPFFTKYCEIRKKLLICMESRLSNRELNPFTKQGHMKKNETSWS